MEIRLQVIVEVVEPVLYVDNSYMNDILNKNLIGRDLSGKFIKGFKHSVETRNKIKKNNSKYWIGKKRPEVGILMSKLHKGNKYSVGVKRSEEYKEKLRQYIGEKNSRYIKDRSKLKQLDHRKSTANFEWRKLVYERDNYICKINNSECNGKIEAHHILPFRDYPEFRCDINNGITLCHFHHPRKREDEKRLSPYLIELINQ